MQVRVLFFGILREVAGIPEDRLEVSDAATLGDIFRLYADRYPAMAAMAASIVMARNHEFSPAGSPVRDGDEIAFLPPVSGGAPGYLRELSENGNFFALTRQPVDVRSLAACVLSGGDGAIVTFEGVVRDNTDGRRTRYLEYHCYEPMAIKVMARIGAEIARSFQVGRLAMVHRLGRLLIGETSVAVLVGAPHRKAAFEAALEGINRLKRQVPIWKKECFADGEVWVEGEWDSGVPVVSPE